MILKRIREENDRLRKELEEIDQLRAANDLLREILAGIELALDRNDVEAARIMILASKGSFDELPPDEAA